MALPKFTEACCGCNLRTGVKFIGIFEDAIGFILLIVSIVNGREFGSLVPKPGMEYFRNVVYGAFITLGVAGCISIVFAIILHVGAKKEYKGFLTAWTYGTILSRILLFIVGVILAWAYAEIGATSQGVTYIVCILIYIGITIYTMLVVRSLRLEFEESPQQQNNAGMARA